MDEEGNSCWMRRATAVGLRGGNNCWMRRTTAVGLRVGNSCWMRRATAVGLRGGNSCWMRRATAVGLRGGNSFSLTFYLSSLSSVTSLACCWVEQMCECVCVCTCVRTRARERKVCAYVRARERDALSLCGLSIEDRLHVSDLTRVTSFRLSRFSHDAFKQLLPGSDAFSPAGLPKTGCPSLATQV